MQTIRAWGPPAEIRHLLTVLSRAPLEIERQGRRVHNEPILSALSAADDDDGWFVARFHVLAARAVISGQYRLSRSIAGLPSVACSPAGC